MKRIILSAIAFMAIGFAHAQNGHFKVGAHAGAVVGDLQKSYSANLGIDAAYLWSITDKFSLGATTGFTAYVPKSYNYNSAPYPGYVNRNPEASFVPVAGTAQYSITDNLFLGADLGFAIFTGKKGTSDGGILYQPKFGYQTNKIELFAAYKGITNDGNIASLNIGFNYKF